MKEPETDPLHREIEEWLAAYADGELAPAQAARVEAHLLGCEPCRRAVALQRAIHDRLAGEEPRHASSALRERVRRATYGALPAPAERALWRRAAPWAGWAVAAVLAGLLILERGAETRLPEFPPAVERMAAADSGQVPMVSEALADYLRLMRNDLPVDRGGLARVEARTPFPVTPLRSPDARLIGAWTTRIVGQPTAVLAYRWRDRVVVQYVVPEALFFAPPEVRRAVAARGRYTTSAGPQGVVAWPGAKNGSILIGELPPAELAELRS